MEQPAETREEVGRFSWAIAAVILVKYDGGQVYLLLLGVTGSGQILGIF